MSQELQRPGAYDQDLIPDPTCCLAANPLQSPHSSHNPLQKRPLHLLFPLLGCSSTRPTASRLLQAQLRALLSSPRHPSSQCAFRNQTIFPASCHLQGTRRPALRHWKRSSAKQGHPPSDAHLRDEATARHRVEAKLAHIPGLGVLSPPACQRKGLLSFPERPDLSRAPSAEGQAWAALLKCGRSEDATSQCTERQGPPASGALDNRAGSNRGS